MLHAWDRCGKWRAIVRFWTVKSKLSSHLYRVGIYLRTEQTMFLEYIFIPSYHTILVCACKRNNNNPILKLTLYKSSIVKVWYIVKIPAIPEAKRIAHLLGEIAHFWVK